MGKRAEKNYSPPLFLPFVIDYLFSMMQDAFDLFVASCLRGANDRLLPFASEKILSFTAFKQELLW